MARSGRVRITSGGSGSGGAPSGSAGGDLTGTYPNPTIGASKVTSSNIVDGTIVTGDLNAAAGITSGQLAGSIAASKITGTAVTAADTGTVTSAMILDATIAAGDIASSAITTAKVASGAASPDKTQDWYLNGSQVIRRNLSKSAGVTAATVTMATGVMSSVALVLYAGDVITNITFRTGTTGVTLGSNADSHWWFALYDTQATPALLSQTADQTTTTWGASTTKTIALSTNGGAQTIATSGVHYAALMVAIGTGGSPATPTLLGITVATAPFGTGLVASQKTLSFTSGSSLTTTAPGTITSATSTALIPYVELS